MHHAPINRRSILKLPLLAAPLLPATEPLKIGKVKITSFEIHKVSVRWRDLLFVEVHTDSGITGQPVWGPVAGEWRKLTRITQERTPR